MAKYKTGDDALVKLLCGRLGEIMKIERERIDLKQEEAAEQLGISQNAVSAWEIGISAGLSKLDALVAVENLFGLDHGTMLFRAGYFSGTPDLESVIWAHPSLSDEQKTVLAGLVRLMVNGDDD